MQTYPKDLILRMIRTINGMINMIEDRAGKALGDIDSDLEIRAFRAIKAQEIEQLEQVTSELDDLTDHILHTEY